MAERKKKKKASKKKKTSTTSNLAALQGQNQQNQVDESKIRQIVREETNQRVAQMYQQINQQIQNLYSKQVKRLAIDEKFMCQELNVNENKLEEFRNDQEDILYGLQKTNDEVQEGDTVRLDLQVRQDDQEDFGPPFPQQVFYVGQEPLSFNEELENALIGLKVGQQTTVPQTSTFPEPDENGNPTEKEFTFHYKFTVKRISRPKQEENQSA